ncbi:hypothetical protein [Endozoicomonas sp. Mp262]|uniref:hypothetical protein n=1 Tax=Endozoicomonas sp. Mp262 TaxID=2919499 RepID=UPI0021DAF4DD
MNFNSTSGFLSAFGIKVGDLNLPMSFFSIVFSKGVNKKGIGFFIFPIAALFCFLFIHLAKGNIDEGLFFKNIFRLLFPFVTACLLAVRFSNGNKNRFVEFSSGILFLCAIDIIPSIIFYAPQFIISVISGNIYFIKDKNILLQNTNYTAFFCFVAMLSIYLSYKIEGVLSKKHIFFAFLLSCLSMSRAYIASQIIILFCFFVPDRFFKKKMRFASIFVFFAMISTVFYFLAKFNFDDTFIRGIRTDVDGSAATKFEIIMYTSSVIKKYGWDFLIGLGPQIIDQSLLVTYASHSMVGIMSELGLFIIVYIMPFFMLALKKPIFFFCNSGFFLAALTTSFPIAYLTPWLMIVYISLYQKNV